MTNLLPHEKHWLKAKLSEGIRQNRDASDAMADAIENGNAWHDNAEYDEVIARMKQIDSTFGPFSLLLNNCVEVEYPHPELLEASLGSIVRLSSADDEMYVALVGSSQVYGDRYEDLWDTDHDDWLMVASADAPIGDALIGASVGDEVSWTVEDGREFRYKVEDVDQNWIQEHFAA